MDRGLERLIERLFFRSTLDRIAMMFLAAVFIYLGLQVVMMIKAASQAMGVY